VRTIFLRQRTVIKASPVPQRRGMGARSADHTRHDTHHRALPPARPPGNGIWTVRSDFRLGLFSAPALAPTPPTPPLLSAAHQLSTRSKTLQSTMATPWSDTHRVRKPPASRVA